MKKRRDFEMRFGNMAVGKGFISTDQLFEAIKIQVTEEIEERRHRLIGMILLDQGLMTLHQVDEVLGAMDQAQKRSTTID